MAAQIFASVLGGFGTNASFAGPFQNGGAFFVVVVDKTASVIRVFKSANGGATWVEADAAHDLAIAVNEIADVNGTTNCQDAGVVSDGTNIYILHARASDTTLCIAQFSMVTSTYSATITGGPAVNHSVTTVGASFQRFLLVKRATGTFVAFYQAMNAGLTATQINFVEVTAGVWGGINSITNGGVNIKLQSAILGTANRIHVFGNTANLIQQTVLANNALAALQVISLNGIIVFPGVYAGPVLGLVTIPGSFFTGGITHLFAIEGISSDTPAWTVLDLTAITITPAGTFGLAPGLSNTNNTECEIAAALDASGAAWFFFSAFLSAGASTAVGIWEANKVGGMWHTNDPSVYGIFNDALPATGQTTFNVSANLIGTFGLAFDEAPGNGNTTTATQMSFFQLSSAGGTAFQPLANLNALACASVVLPFVLSCCRVCDMDPPYQRGKVVYASGSEFEY